MAAEPSSTSITSILCHITRRRRTPHPHNTHTHTPPPLVARRRQFNGTSEPHCCTQKSTCPVHTRRWEQAMLGYESWDPGARRAIYHVDCRLNGLANCASSGPGLNWLGRRTKSKRPASVASKGHGIRKDAFHHPRVVSCAPGGRYYAWRAASTHGHTHTRAASSARCIM